MRILCPCFIRPSLIRTRMTTPRYRAVPAVHQQRLERRVPIPFRRRQPCDQRLQHTLDVQPRLGADLHGIRGVQTDDVLDLLLHPFGFGRWQVDLVEDRHDLVIGIDRLVDVGKGLRFHALRRIDHQQAALARGQATADLIREIDMAGRVHQVQFVGQPILRRVAQPDGLRLDGDAAFLLQLHAVEYPGCHLPRGQAAGELNQPVGQGGFPMVDVRDDREVPDTFEWSVGHGPAL